LLPGDKEFHSVANAGHFSFLAPCDRQMTAIILVMSLFGTDRICNDPTGFDRTKFHAEFNKEVVGFFAKSLATVRP
jgi:predicted dienelactone hydrolase